MRIYIYTCTCTRTYTCTQFGSQGSGLPGGGAGPQAGGVGPEGMYSSMNSGYNMGMGMDGDGRTPVDLPTLINAPIKHTTAHAHP